MRPSENPCAPGHADHEVHAVDGAPGPRHRRRRRHARTAVLALATLAAVTLVGCAADDDTTADDDAATAAEEDFEDMTGEPSVVVQARDNTFVPQHVVISAGTEVTFDNRGRNPHNALPVEDGAFTEVPTEDLQPGDEATVRFDEPGEYPYYCSLHGTETAGMIGTIRVSE